MGRRPSGNMRVVACVMIALLIAANAAGEPARVEKLQRSDRDLKQAVAAWFQDRASAEATYGHISRWMTDEVTDMNNLFHSRAGFNDDISSSHSVRVQIQREPCLQPRL